jgi:hypothetical protein
MLRRRGFRPKPGPPDLPFPPGYDDARRRRSPAGSTTTPSASSCAAIQHPRASFRRRRRATSSGRPPAPWGLVALGLAEQTRQVDTGCSTLPEASGDARVVPRRRARRAARVRRRDRAAVRSARRGGDLDLVAAAEGRLVYAEAKSSPPRQISEERGEGVLRPRGALVPTSRCSSSTPPSVSATRSCPCWRASSRAARRPAGRATRVVREVWSLAPRLPPWARRPPQPEPGGGGGGGPARDISLVGPVRAGSSPRLRVVHGRMPA